jgi:tetratricopeptide (TPR) repeat protein
MRTALLLLAIPLVLRAQGPQPQPTLTGEQLFEARRFDEAKVAFQQRIARDKNNANALFYMGRVEYAQGRSGNAVDWFEKAMERDEKNATYHVWLGNALGDEAQKASKLRQPFLARRVKSEFERAVELDPTQIDAREGLVGFYSMAPGFMGGSMDKAHEQANEIVKLNPVRGHAQLASLAEREKDVVAAEREYKAAIATEPDSAQGYYGLGAFYRRQKRWDESWATYEQLMKLRPGEITVHLTWGGTAAESGRNLERGEREVKFYLANAPKDAPPGNVSNAHWRLGQIYEQTARKNQARSEYNEALKINPRNANAKKSLDALK